MVQVSTPDRSMIHLILLAIHCIDFPPREFVRSCRTPYVYGACHGEAEQNNGYHRELRLTSAITSSSVGFDRARPDTMTAGKGPFMIDDRLFASGLSVLSITKLTLSLRSTAMPLSARSCASALARWRVGALRIRFRAVFRRHHQDFTRLCVCHLGDAHKATVADHRAGSDFLLVQMPVLVTAAKSLEREDNFQTLHFRFERLSSDLSGPPKAIR